MFPKYSSLYASQEGEDVLLKRLLKDDYYGEGFFVDVGAHHPVRFSSTFHYYLKGWRGINIDPLPGTKILFDEMRPDDINLECAVSDVEGILPYYMFDESAFNTFSSVHRDEAEKKADLLETREIEVKRLDKILDEYLPPEQKFLFMTIDVEGYELNVIRSCNWEKYRPRFLCIEELSVSDSDSDSDSDSVAGFLNSVGYSRIAQTKNSCIYTDTRNTLPA